MRACVASSAGMTLTGPVRSAGVRVLFATVLLLNVTAPVGAEEAPVRTGLRADLAAGRWEAVAARLDAAGPRTPVETFILGHAALALNRNNAAVEIFLSATKDADLAAWSEWSRGFAAVDPGNAVAHYLLGDALSRLGRVEDGIAEFDRGLALQPANALLRNARGVAYAALGDTDAALRDLDAALRMRPDLADAHANLGSLWIQQKRGASGASRAFADALKLSPRFVIPLVGRGFLKTNGWPGLSSPGPPTAGRELAEAREDFAAAMGDSDLLKAEVIQRIGEVAARADKEEAERVASALMGGDPGTLIQRNLQDLRNETTAGGAIANLMAIAVSFPDRRADINRGIANAGRDVSDPLEKYLLRTSHLAALNRLAATPVSPPIAAALRGPASTPPPATASQDLGGLRAAATTSRFDRAVRPAFSNLADTLDNTNTALVTATDLLKLSALGPYGSRAGGSNRFGGLVPGMQALSDRGEPWLTLGAAAARDLGAGAAGNYNPASPQHIASSNLFEQSAVLGLKNLTRYAAAQAGSSLPGYWKGIDEASRVVTPFAQAFGSHLATGRVDPDAAAGYGAALGQAILWNAQVQAGGRLLYRPGWRVAGAFSAGLPDLMAFAASRAETGDLFTARPLTVRETEQLTDTVVGATFFGLGTLWGRGNSAAAQMAAQAGRTAAVALREATFPLFAWWELHSLNPKLVALGQSELSVEQLLAASPTPPPMPIEAPPRPNHEAYRIETHAGVTRITPLDQSPGSAGAGDASGLAARSAIAAETMRDVTRKYSTSGNPGGFRTTSFKPLWDDGNWPLRPWYALGYPMRSGTSALQHP